MGTSASKLHAQDSSGVEWGSKYTIAGLTVIGADYTDAQAVKLFSALQIGQEITLPGEEIAKAIRNLWVQQLFDDIAIELAEVRGSPGKVAEARGRLRKLAEASGSLRKREEARGSPREPAVFLSRGSPRKQCFEAARAS